MGTGKKKKKKAAKERKERLVPVYYRIREMLGQPAITRERIRRQELLSPGDDPEAVLRAEDEKRLEMAAACLLGAVILTVLLTMSGGGNLPLILERPGYGEDPGEVSVNLEVDDVAGLAELTVGNLRYTDEEWEKYREEAWERARENALADNEDWEHITTDLDFSKETGIAGITVEWNTGDPDRISYEGEVGDLSDLEAEERVLLTAALRCGDRTWEQEQTAVLNPPVLSGEEEELKAVEAYLQKTVDEEEGAAGELPVSFGDKTIRYLQDDGIPGWILLLLGGMAAAAFWMLPEQRRREKEKAREKELTLSYPELVSNLTVLMGAGLTVRGAWEKMVSQYRHSRGQGGKQRALYEEMTLTMNSLGQGVYEEAAYVAFGKRCGLKPYLRLGSLLETNLRKGNKGLIPLLREEADSAMSERLEQARRLGEETSTKLLMPMLLLFALVLVILVVPAFWSF